MTLTESRIFDIPIVPSVSSMMFVVEMKVNSFDFSDWCTFQ